MWFVVTFKNDIKKKQIGNDYFYGVNIMASFEELKNMILVTEKEEDHLYHMSKKKDHIIEKRRMLPNKKYKKDPEKADRIYAGREEVKNRDSGYESVRKPLSDKGYDTINKAQDYMRKLSQSDKEEDEKKLDTAKKAIHNISKTSRDRDLIITTSDSSKSPHLSDPNGKNKTLVVDTLGKVDDAGLGASIGKKIKLNKRGKYYHASPVKGLTSLKPQRESLSNRNDMKHDDEGNTTKMDVKGSYFYAKKRIYISTTPLKEYAGKNGAIYQLIDIPEYGYTNRIGLYIEPDKPIAVKDVTDQFVKESVIDLKLEIFESCCNGEITEEERDTLLELL